MGIKNYLIVVKILLRHRLIYIYNGTTQSKKLLIYIRIEVKFVIILFTINE